MKIVSLLAAVLSMLASVSASGEPYGTTTVTTTRTSTVTSYKSTTTTTHITTRIVTVYQTPSLSNANMPYYCRIMNELRPRCSSLFSPAPTPHSSITTVKLASTTTSTSSKPTSVAASSAATKKRRVVVPPVDSHASTHLPDFATFSHMSATELGSDNADQSHAGSQDHLDVATEHADLPSEATHRYTATQVHH